MNPPGVGRRRAGDAGPHHTINDQRTDLTKTSGHSHLNAPKWGDVR